MIFGKKDVEARDRLIQYKKTFSSVEGRAVFLDLMNRYHMINKLPGKTDREANISEGERNVVCWIGSQIGFKIEDFDKLLRGELK